MLSVKVVCHSVCLFFFFKLCRQAHSLLGDLWGVRRRSSVSPVGGAAIAGLAALGFLLHAAGLTALARTTLSVLCEVMVQQLRVGLLMRRQDVKERSRGVAWSAARVQWSCPPQC